MDSEVLSDWEDWESQMRLLFATCVLIAFGLSTPSYAKGMGPDFYKVQRTPGKPKTTLRDDQPTGTVQDQQRTCSRKNRKAC
jgi:hypothetical protein